MQKAKQPAAFSALLFLNDPKRFYRCKLLLPFRLSSELLMNPDEVSWYAFGNIMTFRNCAPFVKMEYLNSAMCAIAAAS